MGEGCGGDTPPGGTGTAPTLLGAANIPALCCCPNSCGAASGEAACSAAPVKLLIALFAMTWGLLCRSCTDVLPTTAAAEFATLMPVARCRFAPSCCLNSSSRVSSWSRMSRAASLGGCCCCCCCCGAGCCWWSVLSGSRGLMLPDPPQAAGAAAARAPH